MKSAIKYGRDSLNLDDVLRVLKYKEFEIKIEKKLSAKGLQALGRSHKRDSTGELAISTNGIYHVWVMDSSHTFHMAPRKDLMLNFKFIKSGKVFDGQ